MRVAVTDFTASYSIASQGRGGTFQTGSSLKSPEQNDGSYLANPFEAALSLLREVKVDPTRLGIICGASKGDLDALSQWSQLGDFHWPADFVAHHLAQLTSAQGPILAPNAACATSTHALALAAQSIQKGQVDMVLAGGVEWPQPELILAAYRNMHAFSKQGIIRPFDRRRDGFVPSAGHGFLLLENEEFAKKRGAKVYGYLTGWSMKCDATHMTSMLPGGETIARAIEDALEKADQPQIDYINAHGTATQLNDVIETRAIKSVFGDRVPISSTKPLTGHMLGAAGAMEAAISLLALQENFAPPTWNLEEPGDECDLDYIPLVGRSIAINSVLTLNYGFGGHIGALIFEKA